MEAAIVLATRKLIAVSVPFSRPDFSATVI
jgi:hypothetical protein